MTTRNGNHLAALPDTTENAGDTAALIEFVKYAAQLLEEIHATGVTDIVWPDGQTHRIDQRSLDAKPDRMRGTTHVHRLDHIRPLVEQKGDLDSPQVVTYADHKARTFTTILNDESAAIDDWAHLRVVYACDPSPAWKVWTMRSGELLPQETFAEHIEDRLPDIINPSPADLLEIAQTMAASGTVEMRSARRLMDGRTQLSYHEDTTAVGGSDGQLEIPKEITLLIPIFHGTVAQEITARFRYRFRNGDLKIGYILNQPDEIERAAFAQLVDELAAAVPWTVIEAAAPRSQVTAPILIAQKMRGRSYLRRLKTDHRRGWISPEDLAQLVAKGWVWSDETGRLWTLNDAGHAAVRESTAA